MIRYRIARMGIKLWSILLAFISFSGIALFVLLTPHRPADSAASGTAAVGYDATGPIAGGTSAILAGLVHYENAKYHFSLYHAPNEEIRDYDEGGGAMTITLENVKTVRGLQIFIVPYAGSTISEERFKEDVPSGIRNNAENTALDGVRAVTFTSHDAILGDTRELWIIRGGYLYEITTPAGDTDWFASIIGTWRFLP